MGQAMHGLTPAQREIVKLEFAVICAPVTNWGTGKGNPLEGWSIYREPITINPPTILRLHHRNGLGKLDTIISITEKGTTKCPQHVGSSVSSSIGWSRTISALTSPSD